MTPIPRRHWLGYSVAAASVAVAFAASLAVRDAMGTTPFLLFFPAVMLSGWLGGFGPGMFATSLSLLLSWYFFIPEFHAFRIRSGADALRMVLFFLEGVFITLLNDAFHHSRRRTAEARAGEQLAAETVARAEHRYRAFVENSSEAIWRFECDEPIPTSLAEDEQIDRMYRVGYLAECNEAMARMYGYERAADLVGKRLGDLMPRDAAANVAYLRAFIRGGYRTTEAESEERDRNGRTVFLINNLLGMVEDGNVVRAWGTQRHVTEQRTAEAARRRSAERVQLVTDAIPSLISFIDREHRYTLANRAYETWVGQRPDQIVGRTMREVLGDAAWGSIRLNVEAALAGKTVRYETRVVYP